MERKASDIDRQELFRHLLTVPAHTILQHLQEDTILEIATKCFEDKQTEHKMTQYPEATPTGHHLQFQHDGPETKGTGKQAVDRAKRPLNAFIAFRSFYVKLFPASQQKAASGFLTTLWNKDPSRNRWALIAKVYSFVRDELGKKKAPLSTFLLAACPAMDILHPDEYLRVLGWIVEDTELGTKKLVQRDELRAPKEPTGPCPDSELQLLQKIIEMGYMAGENLSLLEALVARDNRSALTSTISISEPAAIKSDPEICPQNATESTSAPEQEIPAPRGDSSFCTPILEASTPYRGTSPSPEETSTPSTCASISTPPIQPAAPSPSASTPLTYFGLTSLPTAEPTTAAASTSYFYPSYHYHHHFAAEDSTVCSPASSFGGDTSFNLGSSGPTSHPAYVTAATTSYSPAVLSLDGVADHQAFDIDCPWEIDSVLGTCTQPPSGERVFGLDSGPEYDSYEDFHYTF